MVAAHASASCVTLSWTAPGDDGHSGQAAKYEVRFSTSFITEANWSSVSSLPNPPLPAKAGVREFVTISDLKGGTRYYFAVKTADECGNWSGMSSVVTCVAPEDVCDWTVGNANCDPDDNVTVGDIVAITDYLFNGGPMCCPLEANVNNDPEGRITVSDIAALIDYLFADGPLLPACPR